MQFSFTRLEDSVESQRRLQDYLNRCDAWIDPPLSARTSPAEFAKKILAYGSAIMAFAENHREAGLVAFYANDRNTQVAYITLVAVTPEFRAKGLGRQLVEMAITESRSEGMVLMRLEVYHDNNPAIALYKRCGFLECDEPEGVSREDKSIFMECHL
jgi:ribosomal protein S18 acetylase RimI-like enzyme